MPLVRKDAPAGNDRGGEDDAFVRIVRGTTDERCAAARTLATRPGGVGALAAALAIELEPRAREAILTSLARSSEAGAVEAVLPHLRSDEASIRTGALDALRVMPEALRPHLRALLADGDADVRLLVCDLLREQPAREAAVLLAHVLDVETQVNVCAAAVDVLAELGDVDSLPALERCAARFPNEPFLQFAVKVAVSRIGGLP